MVGWVIAQPANGSFRHLLTTEYCNGGSRSCNVLQEGESFSRLPSKLQCCGHPRYQRDSLKRRPCVLFQVLCWTWRVSFATSISTSIVARRRFVRESVAQHREIVPRMARRLTKTVRPCSPAANATSRSAIEARMSHFARDRNRMGNHVSSCCHDVFEDSTRNCCAWKNSTVSDREKLNFSWSNLDKLDNPFDSSIYPSINGVSDKILLTTWSLASSKCELLSSRAKGSPTPATSAHPRKKSPIITSHRRPKLRTVNFNKIIRAANKQFQKSWISQINRSIKLITLSLDHQRHSKDTEIEKLIIHE